MEIKPVQKYKERNITLIKYDIFIKYFEFIILVKELKKIKAKGYNAIKLSLPNLDANCWELVNINLFIKTNEYNNINKIINSF